MQTSFETNPQETERDEPTAKPSSSFSVHSERFLVPNGASRPSGTQFRSQTALLGFFGMPRSREAQIETKISQKWTQSRFLGFYMWATLTPARRRAPPQRSTGPRCAPPQRRRRETDRGDPRPIQPDAQKRLCPAPQRRTQHHPDSTKSTKPSTTRRKKGVPGSNRAPPSTKPKAYCSAT